MASPNSSQTWVFASRAAHAAACFAYQYCLLFEEFHVPSYPDRTPSSAWWHPLLLVSTIGFRVCHHHWHQRPSVHSLRLPCQQWRQRTRSTLTKVPSLLQDLVESLPEVGVEDLSEGGLSQMFPTDPHNAFGSARSVQLSPHQQIKLITRWWLVDSSAPLFTWVFKTYECPVAMCSDGHPHAWP